MQDFRRYGFANPGAAWWRLLGPGTANSQRIRRYAIHIALSRDPPVHITEHRPQICFEPLDPPGAPPGCCD